MSNNVVSKKCMYCDGKFETSKFTPYVMTCSVCKGKGLAGPIKKKVVEEVKKDKGKSAKATKPGIKARGGKVDVVQVLAVPVAPPPKVYIPVENKEAIFLHLLQRGYKLSGMNTPYKIYPKVKVMCPLDGAYTKVIVNYLHSDGKFDGSNILMTKKDVKELPKEVREELVDVIDLIYPEAAK